MSSSNTGSGELWLPSVIVLAVFAIGFASGPRVSTISRPSAALEGITANASKGWQTIPARLWQDPFEATIQPRKPLDTVKREPPQNSERSSVRLSELIAHHTSRDANREPNGTISYKNSHRVLFLFASLPSEEYPESAEQRIRTRVAVVSALTTAGYMPSVGSHLGLATWDASNANGALTSQREYPFEAFMFAPRQKFLQMNEQYSRKYDEVIVLYVAEDALEATKQLQWLEELSRLFARATPPYRFVDRNWVAVRWLGPNTSDRLVALLHSAIQRPPQFESRRLAIPLTILAVRPSIEPEFVYKMVGAETSPQKHLASALQTTPRKIALSYYSRSDKRFPWLAIEPESQHEIRWSSLARGFALRPYLVGGYFTKTRFADYHRGAMAWVPWITIQRLGCDDGLLATALVNEVCRRVDRSGDKKGRVVLLSEWDTLYGQALPKSFARAFIRKEWDSSRVKQYTYLRGLDGRVPGELERKTAEVSKGGERTDILGELLRSRAPAIAYGRTQVDYVDRLAAQLIEDDKKQRIKAVGVLGSDPYDKLLILQGLRKALPSVQYFTTDLDASFISPEQYEITRNLLVASGFGLRLSDKHQGSILPFRDSCQGSVYFATLWATDYFTVKSNETQFGRALSAWTPAVFEIGRNDAHLLRSNSPAGTPLSPPTSTNDGNAPFPETSVGSGGRVNLWLSPLIAGIIVGASSLTWHGRTALRRSASATMIAFRQLRRLPRSSKKRTALLRFVRSIARDATTWLLIAAAIAFLAIAVEIPKIARSANEEPLLLAEGISSWPATWLRALAIFLAACYFWIITWHFRATLRACQRSIAASTLATFRSRRRASDSPPRLLWSRFCKRSRGFELKIIILFGWILYSFGGWTLFDLLGAPANVTRGTASQLMETGVLLTAVFAMNFLIVYAVVHNFSCALMIREAGEWLAHAETPATNVAPLHGELMKVIGQIGGVMTQMIYYPFTLLFLLVAARQPLFDNFDWPASLITILCLGSLILLSSALVVRRSANQARESAVKWLEERIANLRWRKDARRATQRAELQLAQVQQIGGAALSEGLLSNPILRAVLIPVGGTGILQVMEFVSRIS